MAGFRHVEELEVYQLCDQVRLLMRPILERPVFNRDPDLRSQLRRASEGPCPHLTEGFSRFYPADNARFVRIALGSLKELMVHMERALAGRFVAQKEPDDVVRVATSAAKAATGYIKYLDRAEVPGAPRRRRTTRNSPPSRKDGNPRR